MKEIIKSTIVDLGVPANIRGCEYLADAVVMALEDKELVEILTGRLYPRVAEKYGVTLGRVERSVCHAVQVARAIRSGS